MTTPFEVCEHEEVGFVSWDAEEQMVLLTCDRCQYVVELEVPGNQWFLPEDDEDEDEEEEGDYDLSHLSEKEREYIEEHGLPQTDEEYKAMDAEL